MPAKIPVSFPDLEDAPAQEQEKSALPAEPAENDLVGDQPADDGVGDVSPVEAEARERGWRPQEEWVEAGGDPDEWYDARTFVDRGRLMDVISKQNKKIKSLSTAVEDFKVFHSKVEEQAYKKAKEKLLEEKAEALELSDHRRAVEIDEELKELDAPKPDKAEASVDPYAEYFEDVWISKNAWYNEDKTMRIAADAYGVEFYNEDTTISPEELFKKVDKKIKEEFSHKFAKGKGSHNPILPAGRGGKTNGEAGKVAARMRALTTEERSVGNRFVQNGLFETLEDYVKDLVKHGL